MTTTTTRIGASIAAIALATGAALATAAPASAATTVGNTTYYGLTDFGTESAGYPDTAWFYGAISAPFSPPPVGFLAGGLTVETVGGEKFQILTNLAATAPADELAFTTFVTALAVQSADSGWYFQLPLYGNGEDQFTTLRPASPGVNPEFATDWVTSGDIFPDENPLSPPTYTAGSTATLAQFATALYAGDDPVILAAGVFVDESTPTQTIAGFWVGDQYSAFSPVVSRTVTPNPVTPAQTSTSGIRFQGSGWLPGSEVYIAINSACDEGGTEYFRDTSNVAAPDGTVDVTIVLPESLAVGTYCVEFDDDGPLFNGDAMPPVSLVVANVLPATGLEVTAPLVGGIAFLVIGGLALVATRRVERGALG